MVSVSTDNYQKNIIKTLQFQPVRIQVEENKTKSTLLSFQKQEKPNTCIHITPPVGFSYPRNIKQDNYDNRFNNGIYCSSLIKTPMQDFRKKLNLLQFFMSKRKLNKQRHEEFFKSIYFSIIFYSCKYI